MFDKNEIEKAADQAFRLGANVALLPKTIIKKMPAADSRTAKDKVSIEELYKASLAHINDVRSVMDNIRHKLEMTAYRHDWTKIAYIEQFHADFARAQNTEEDFTAMKWHKLHVEQERHHLNHRCPDDVNMFDVIERIADICTAAKARGGASRTGGASGKVFEDTLPAEVLVKAYKNTINLVLDSIIVDER